MSSYLPLSKRHSLDSLLHQSPWNLVQQINTLQPAYNKYESSSESGDRQLVVMEVESVDHRGAVKNEFFIQLFQEELYWMVRKEFLTQPAFHKTTPRNLVDEVWSNSWLHDSTPPSWLFDWKEE